MPHSHKSYVRVHGNGIAGLHRSLGLEILDLGTEGLVEEDVPFGYSPDNPYNCPRVLNCPGVRNPENLHMCFSNDCEYSECKGVLGDSDTDIGSRTPLEVDEDLQHLVNHNILAAKRLIRLGEIAHREMQILYALTEEYGIQTSNEIALAQEERDQEKRDKRNERRRELRKQKKLMVAQR